MATTLTTSYQRISTINVSYGQIRTYAKYNSQSTANNTTTISLKTTYYLSQWIQFSSGSSTLDGTTKNYGNTRFNAGETTLQEFTRTLNHNSDGTSPTKTVSTSWSASFGGGGSTSASVVAPKILRQATITSAPDFNDEQNPTIKYTNPAGNSVNTLMACITTASDGTIRVPYRDISKTGTSYTFNLTESERNTLRSLTPNSTTLQVKFFIRTNIGGTNLYSSVERTMTIVNGNPTFSAAYLDTNSTTTAITNNNQKIIRNNSTLQVTVTNASAKKYATLSSIKTVLNGVTYNGTISGTTATFNIGTLNVSSNTTAAVTLTDSRGLKTTQNLTIQVLDWVLPSAIITAQRENNFYNPTTINVDASYSSLDGENTLTIQMRYKKTTDSDYGSYQTLQDDTPTTVQLDNNYEWNVQVLLTDRLGTKTYNLLIERGIPIAFFDRKKRSLGIDCFPTDSESLEVNGENILTRIAGYGQGANQVTGNWNTACGTASGFYMGQNLSNAPSGQTVNGWWWIIHLVHNDKYQRQIAFSFLNNVDMYTRIMNNGTWNSWTLVGEKYSTSEQVIGTWTDGKPIYRKVISIGTLPGSSGAKNTAHEISNIGNLIRIYGFAYSGGTRFPLPYTTNVNSSNIALYANNTNVIVEVGQSRSAYTAYAILEYTKN